MWFRDGARGGIPKGREGGRAGTLRHTRAYALRSRPLFVSLCGRPTPLYEHDHRAHAPSYTREFSKTLTPHRERQKKRGQDDFDTVAPIAQYSQRRVLRVGDVEAEVPSPP